MYEKVLEDAYSEDDVLLDTAVVTKEPIKYKVIMLNDDYTPMAFVVEVLKYFFNFDETSAVSLMFQVHVKGRAMCGVFTKDVAETKVALVTNYARANQHPLLCCIEPN